MRPSTSALIDQAQAAAGETARIMAGLAVLENTAVRHVIPGPIHRAILARFSIRALGGQLTLCPDLTYDAPRPSFWCAWAPGRIRCTQCAETASRRIHGTPEDRRCDHCRKIRPSIHRGAMELPSVVVDLPIRAKCVPPVIVLFGLCPACYDADVPAPGAEYPGGSPPPADPTSVSGERSSEPPQPDVPASGGASKKGMT